MPFLSDPATRIERNPRQPFFNHTIEPPVPTKPHICKRAGYWRVSPWSPRNHQLFYPAHSFINRLNRHIVPKNPKAASKASGVAN